MKGKNWVVSLLAVAVVLPMAEVLLINIEDKNASIFEAEIETIVSSDGEEETCGTKDGLIPCPS
ncbi:MAG: hypothetical protein SXA11_11270 [Cyanobacteriota bacterium]|nr:hypothetical protein [Cyanobacteriota bacterium]